MTREIPKSSERLPRQIPTEFAAGRDERMKRKDLSRRELDSELVKLISSRPLTKRQVQSRAQARPARNADSGEKSRTSDESSK